MRFLKKKNTSQIRSYLEVDFLHDANTSIDMEVIHERISRWSLELVSTQHEILVSMFIWILDIADFIVEIKILVNRAYMECKLYEM